MLPQVDGQFFNYLNNKEVDPICSRNSRSSNRLCHESMISTTECVRKDHQLNVIE